MIGDFAKRTGRLVRTIAAALVSFALIFGAVLTTPALAITQSDQTQLLAASDSPQRSGDLIGKANGCPNCAEALGILAPIASPRAHAPIIVRVEVLALLCSGKSEPALPPPRSIG